MSRPKGVISSLRNTSHRLVLTRPTTALFVGIAGRVVILPSSVEILLLAGITLKLSAFRRELRNLRYNRKLRAGLPKASSDAINRHFICMVSLHQLWCSVAVGISSVVGLHCVE
jgi:hypothetical protein